MMVTNPFSTRFTRPGAISFTSDRVDPHRLVGVLSDYRASRSGIFQIVGPHGCGKTTLTVAIAARLAEQGRAARWLTVRGRSKTDPVRFDHFLPRIDSQPRSEIMVIDGIESVNAVQRSCILRQMSKRAWRVVLTTHRPAWRVPVLAELQPSRERFHDLCKQLLGDHLVGENKSDWQRMIEAAYDNASGNFREAFFELYDQFERVKSAKQLA